MSRELEVDVGVTLRGSSVGNVRVQRLTPARHHQLISRRDPG
jgi:hypothetical protein